MAEAGETWETLERDGRPVALVFTHPDGRPILETFDQDAWSRLLERAGLPHVSRYTARHSAASMLVDMGVEISVVASILGHADTAITYRTYVHPYRDKQTAAMDAMAAALHS